MNCPDAREGFRAFFRGGMSLTELALLDAHVRQCGDCRKERESVEAALNSRPQVTPARVVLHSLSNMIDAAQLGAASFAAGLTRRRVAMSIPVTVASLASVRVIEANRVATMWLVGWLARMGGLLPTLFTLSARVVASVTDATAFVKMWLADLVAQLHLSLTIAVRGTAQATIETARAGRLVKHCARRQIARCSSGVTAFQEAVRAAIEGARTGATRVLDVVLLVHGLRSVLVILSQRAAANVGVASRFASAPLVDLLARTRGLRAMSLRVSGATAGRVTAASRVAPIRDLNPLTWMRGLPGLLTTLSKRVAGHGIAATWIVGRVVVTFGRTLSLPDLSAVAPAWHSIRSRASLKNSTLTSGRRYLLGVRTGIASLVILVTALL